MLLILVCLRVVLIFDRFGRWCLHLVAISLFLRSLFVSVARVSISPLGRLCFPLGTSSTYLSLSVLLRMAVGVPALVRMLFGLRFRVTSSVLRFGRLSISVYMSSVRACAMFHNSSVYS